MRNKRIPGADDHFRTGVFPLPSAALPQRCSPSPRHSPRQQQAPGMKNSCRVPAYIYGVKTIPLSGKNHVLIGEKPCSYWGKSMFLLGKKHVLIGEKAYRYWGKSIPLLGKKHTVIGGKAYRYWGKSIPLLGENVPLCGWIAPLCTLFTPTRPASAGRRAGSSPENRSPPAGSCHPAHSGSALPPAGIPRCPTSAPPDT